MDVKETTKDIVKLNPADYGLSETKAGEIEAMFKPMLKKMVELEDEFNEILKLDINEETCIKAHDLRMKYVKVRTGTAAIHKELKAFYLNGGRFVDGWKNAQLFASQGNEDKLGEIENYYENLEHERIIRLQEKRAREMGKYEIEHIPDNLGQMSDDVWANFILGTKTNYEARKEAERKVEEERIAREKAEAEEREHIRKENIRLQKEAEERVKLAKIEAEKRIREEAARKAKEEAERKKREEKERKEREAHEIALRKEREEREKIEAELRAKRETEEKARKEAEEKTRKEEEARKEAERESRLAPDKKKLENLVSEIELIKFPDVKSQEAFEVIKSVREQFDQIKQFIINKSKNL